MNLSDILSLPARPSNYLIRADDTGNLYQIGAGAIGATAQVIGNHVVNPTDQTLIIGSGVTEITDHAVKYVIISNGVTSIGAYAFNSFISLASIEIPNSVVSIGDSAFNACSSLVFIDIPNSVVSIGDSAFSNCSSLTSVTIPESVTTISDVAFYFCTSLAAVYFEGNAPSTFGEDVFAETDPAILYYRPSTSGWSNPFNGYTALPWTSFPDPMP